MTKAELTRKVAEQGGLTAAAAKNAVETVLEQIAYGVMEEGAVVIQGFGIFKKETRKGRMGRNPKTGESVEIQPKDVVKFKCKFM